MKEIHTTFIMLSVSCGLRHQFTTLLLSPHGTVAGHPHTFPGTNEFVYFTYCFSPSNVYIKEEICKSRFVMYSIETCIRHNFLGHTLF